MPDPTPAPPPEDLRVAEVLQKVRLMRHLRPVGTRIRAPLPSLAEDRTLRPISEPPEAMSTRVRVRFVVTVASSTGGPIALLDIAARLPERFPGALLIAQRCLADADNGQVNRFDRQATSVILGCAATTQLVAHMSGRMSRPMWKQGLKNAGFDEATAERACEAIADQFIPWQESTFPGLLGNVIAGRIANRFDLGGTNCVLDAACASSLAALSMALGELRSGRMDTVITGGVDALNDILMFLCFSQTPALSMT
jgi:hypothetical protein